MANFSPNISLELPTSPEHYDIGVFNKNNMVIDSEINKLNIKNQSQDEILTAEVSRATNKENELTEILNGEISRATNAEEAINREIENIYENVNNMHVHNNKSTLDKISESDTGTLLFDGKEFSGENDTILSNYLKSNGDASDTVSTGAYKGVESIPVIPITLDGYPMLDIIPLEILRHKFFKINKAFNDLVDKVKENISNHLHGNMKTITFSTTEPTNIADGEIVMVYEE